MNYTWKEAKERVFFFDETSCMQGGNFCTKLEDWRIQLPNVSVHRLSICCSRILIIHRFIPFSTTTAMYWFNPTYSVRYSPHIHAMKHDASCSIKHQRSFLMLLEWFKSGSHRSNPHLNLKRLKLLQLSCQHANATTFHIWSSFAGFPAKTTQGSAMN